MKIAKKLFATAVAATMLFSFAACGETPKENTESTGYKDTIERPEIEMPVAADQVVYPEKPAEAPVTPSEGTVPSVKNYTASDTDSSYTIAQADGVTSVSYQGVSDWSYIYASVENYSPQYGNIKITIRNGTPAAERIAVQAVYYEAYDLGYAPVTVYLGEMSEGEQYVIAELGDSLITDASYQQVKGESVRDKTVIGFVIFVDSLPSFAPTEASGAFEIVGFEFLRDGDPALDDRYVKPAVDLSAATEENGSAFFPVSKYSADYTKFTVELSGETGAQADIAVRYTLDGRTAVSAPQRVTLNAPTQTAEYDFGDLRPTEGDNDFTTQLIKNGVINDVVVTSVDADAAVEVENISFVRTATDGAYVADVWSSAASDVNVMRAANGGNAKIEYSFYTSWYNFSASVRKGAGVNKIRFTIYAPDGLDHLGIGITNNCPLSSNGQNAGTFILRGASYLFNGESTDTIGVNGTLNSSEPNLEGLTETIAYDATTKIYTVTYDFSGIEKINFPDYTLTSIIFYLNCPDTDDTLKAHTFTGTRSLYFLSIDLYSE